MTLFAFVALPFCAFGGKEKSAARPEAVRVSALNGPSAIPMAYLFENRPALGGIESSFGVAASPDILLPKMIKGEIDIGILPINVAAKVYNANNGTVVLLAVTGEGMINLVTKDASITSLASLRGKRVYVAGQGATPDYMTRYLLASNGIAVGEGADAVALDYSIAAPEIAPAILSGKIAYAVVPEPFATVITDGNPAFRRAIDFQKEFAALQKGGGPRATYPITALVARAEFARAYPHVLRLFLDAMERAVLWTNVNPQDAGLLAEKHALGLRAAVAARSIPTSAFVFTAARDARPSVEHLLNIFMRNDPASVGGKLPDDKFYFK
jgi:NitT/TauT family transport system substrate-binding protein